MIFGGLQDMCEGALTVGETNAVLNGCGKVLSTKKLELECSHMTTGRSGNREVEPQASVPAPAMRSKEFLLLGS